MEIFFSNKYTSYQINFPRLIKNIIIINKRISIIYLIYKMPFPKISFVYYFSSYFFLFNDKKIFYIK